MISLFADKNTDEATMQLYDVLEQFKLPEDVNVTINNLPNAESGLLFQEGKLVDISLANCYNMEDVVVSLIQLLSDYAVEKHSKNGNS